MTEKPRQIETIDGVEYEVTIFMGDGKLYDSTNTSDGTIRQGSRLLTPMVVVEEVPEPQPQAQKYPVIPDDPSRPWYLL